MTVFICVYVCVWVLHKCIVFSMAHGTILMMTWQQTPSFGLLRQWWGLCTSCCVAVMVRVMQNLLVPWQARTKRGGVGKGGGGRAHCSPCGLLAGSWWGCWQRVAGEKCLHQMACLQYKDSSHLQTRKCFQRWPRSGPWLDDFSTPQTPTL